MADSIINIDVLVGMQTGSGTPIFLKNQTPQEIKNRIDAFGLLAPEEASFTIKFSSDIVVTKQVGDTFDVYYTYYQNVDRQVTEDMLKYNYNMTTASVDAEFVTILSKITQELTPPKSSRTFAYDFKFAQNQNASISGSRGGGY